jgi:hypothetical protein
MPRLTPPRSARVTPWRPYLTAVAAEGSRVPLIDADMSVYTRTPDERVATMVQNTLVQVERVADDKVMTASKLLNSRRLRRILHCRQS